MIRTTLYQRLRYSRCFVLGAFKGWKPEGYWACVWGLLINSGERSMGNVYCQSGNRDHILPDLMETQPARPLHNLCQEYDTTV